MPVLSYSCLLHPVDCTPACPHSPNAIIASFDCVYLTISASAWRRLLFATAEPSISETEVQGFHCKFQLKFGSKGKSKRDSKPKPGYDAVSTDNGDLQKQINELSDRQVRVAFS